MPAGLDHLVLAAHDLERQRSLYERLGFRIGARNRHAWGTLNHIVQFPGVFLELISTEPGFERPPADAPVAGLACFIDDYLRKRDGFAMLVLESKDAAADHSRLQAAGIAAPETFYFERQGRRADGSEVKVAFSLAFARHAAIPDAGFFLCQQHNPENFWSQALQIHPNTVRGIASVVLVSHDPAAELGFIEAFVGGVRGRPIEGGHVVDTGRGAIELLTRTGLAYALGDGAIDPGLPMPGWAAVRFVVDEMAAVRGHVETDRIPHYHHRGRIVVPPDAGFGVALSFEPRHVA